MDASEFGLSASAYADLFEELPCGFEFGLKLNGVIGGLKGAFGVFALPVQAGEFEHEDAAFGGGKLPFALEQAFFFVDLKVEGVFFVGEKVFFLDLAGFKGADAVECGRVVGAQGKDTTITSEGSAGMSKTFFEDLPCAK